MTPPPAISVLVGGLILADLGAVLEDRLERFGEPGHAESSTQRTVLSLATGVGRLAAKADIMPGTRPESVVFFRDLLLAQAATALRAAAAIDRYDLALHWAEQERPS